MDYYAILEIPRGSSKEVIKKAFHRLAHIHHPDKGGNAEKFKEISLAYHELQKGAPAQSTYASPQYSGFTVYYSNGNSYAEQMRKSQENVDAAMKAFQDAVEESLRRAQYNWGTE